MSRAVLSSPEDFLINEPYKSIINILMIAPPFDKKYKDGMPIDVLKCLIIKDYSTPEQFSDFRKFLVNNAAGRVTLDQDIKPGNYKKKKTKDEISTTTTDQDIKPGNYKKKTENEISTTTTIHHLFREYLKRLEDVGWIIRDHRFCSLSEKYKTLSIKIWHKEIIDKSKRNNIFAIQNHVFYFPFSHLDVKNSYLSDDDIIKISQICEELSNKIKVIDITFRQAGVRKAISSCRGFLETLPFKNKALKELFDIYLIGDLAAGLGLINYKYVKEKDADPYDFLANQMSFINLIKEATEQYLKTKYKLSEEEFRDIEKKYNSSYYELHTALTNTIHSYASSYTNYSIVSERPYLYGGKIKSPVINFQKIGNMINYEAFIKKQKKNIQSDNDSVSLKELFNIQHRQEKIVENITNVFQDTLPKKPIRQKKSSFFKDNNFLDGFEDDLKELGMTIGEAYEKLDDTATLFNKY